MNKTWTRNDLMEAISDSVGLSLTDSSEIRENIFDFILKELENGKDVKISSFGTFMVKRKNSRIGRNPKTGIEVSIIARNVVSFHSSNVLKSENNNYCVASYRKKQEFDTPIINIQGLICQNQKIYYQDER